MKLNYTKIFKRIGITLLIIIALITALIFSLRIPKVQNFIKDQVVIYLEKKIKTDVELEYIYVDFPSNLVMKNLYLKGEDVDTLLAVRKLDVGLDIWQILNQKVEINSIDLEGTKANVILRKDGTFNFDYITNAFDTGEPKQEKDDSKPFQIALDKIKVKDIDLNYNDLQSGNHINVKFNSFDTRIKEFDLEKNKYAIGKINLDGLKLRLKQDFIANVIEKTTKEETSNQAPLQLSLDQIKLSNFDISYDDDNSKMKALVQFKELKTLINKIDLEKNAFGIDGIDLNGLKVNFKQGLNTTTKESTESLPLSLALNYVKLKNSLIDYADENSKISAKIDLENLETKINKLDLENSYFDLENILLANTNIKANLDLKNTNQQTTTSPETSKPITVVLKNGNIDNLNVVYNNVAEKPTKAGIDFNHLNFNNLNLGLQDFKMYDNQFSGLIKNFTFKEKSGLQLQAFTTNFLYANNEAYLKDLYLRTPNTILQNEVKLSYSSVEQLSNDLDNVRVYANIKNSKIGFKDLLILSPDLKNTIPFNKYPTETLFVGANVNGKVSDLMLNNFTLKGFDQTTIKASGRIKNATNVDRLYYDLNIADFSVSSKTIYTIAPKNTIPNDIRIPSKISLKGNLKGSTKVIDTDLNLTSTLGNAKLTANVDMRKTNAETYSVLADVKNFQVGKIINNDEIGNLTTKINVKGKGFDPKTAELNAYADLISLDFNAYQLKDIKLSVNADKGEFFAKLDSDNLYANLDLEVLGSYKNDELRNVKIDGIINEINLKKLKLSEKPLILAGGIQGTFAELDLDNLNGNLKLSNFAISDTKEIYLIQDVVLTCITNENSNQISLNSQLIDVEVSGKYKFSQIIASLTNTINKYYQFQKEEYKEKIEPNQHIALTVNIKNDDLLRKFVPDLTNFEPITLNATYDADSEKIDILGKIPTVVYNDLNLGNIVLKASNSEEKLNFNLDIHQLQNADFQFNNIYLSGDIEDNLISFEAKKDDDNAKTQFLVAGNLKKENDVTTLHLNENGLILNYDQWNVNQENSISLKENSLFANNFILGYKDSKISLQSEERKGSDILNVAIDNFKIETITEIIKKDELPASGLVNGTARIKDLMKEMVFTTDLLVSDLNVFSHPVGNIIAKVENSSPTLLDVDVELAGKMNNLKVTGDYDIDKSAFDLILNINHLDMTTIQSLSNKMISDVDGFISGKIAVTGTVDKPNVIGDIKFNDVGLTVNSTGSNFRNIDDSILLTSKGIEFNKFKINDKEDNSLTINGAVLTQNYQDFKFDLTAVGRNFKVVNSEKASDSMLYGILAVNANLQILGDLDLPKVNGSLTITDETDFTFVVPQSSPELQEREGIVEFIDKNQINLQETITTNEINTQTNITGLDVNVNIEVNKKAKSTIVIDQANGDFLEVQGEAQLTGGIDPSGKTTLVGVFEIENGAYELTVSLIKKRFDIKKGSTITWTGEPTTAQLNITAIYPVSAAPIDLVQQQLTGLSANEVNMYKQRIPFNTNLILTGELLNPTINFNITLNDNNPSVPSSVIDNTKSKLEQLRTDEAELNKQVFALILLGRFIGENPFQSQSGMSAETLAKQSVSNILAQQLNNVASDLIKGVDINFGLNTEDDYSTGNKNTRTDLNVSVSKKLLNDRLKIMVGSNFGLEGETRENENAANIAGDITIDYSLSRNGRYMLRAYRKNEYQVALHGQVIETGVGFIITLDYDKFKNIFRKHKRDKKDREHHRTESK